MKICQKLRRISALTYLALKKWHIKSTLKTDITVWFIVAVTVVVYSKVFPSIYWHNKKKIKYFSSTWLRNAIPIYIIFHSLIWFLLQKGHDTWRGYCEIVSDGDVLSTYEFCKQERQGKKMWCETNCIKWCSVLYFPSSFFFFWGAYVHIRHTCHIMENVIWLCNSMWICGVCVCIMY